MSETHLKLEKLVREEKVRAKLRSETLERIINDTSRSFLALRKRMFNEQIPGIESFEFELDKNWEEYIAWVFGEQGYLSKASRSQKPEQWLSSNKARKFAMGLFSDMFDKVRRYALNLAEYLEPNPRIRQFAQDYLVCLFFTEVLGGSISGGKGAGSRPLICDHSFQKKRSNMLELLKQGLRRADVKKEPVDWTLRKNYFRANYRDLSHVSLVKYTMMKRFAMAKFNKQSANGNGNMFMGRNDGGSSSCGSSSEDEPIVKREFSLPKTLFKNEFKREASPMDSGTTSIKYEMQSNSRLPSLPPKLSSPATSSASHEWDEQVKDLKRENEMLRRKVYEMKEDRDFQINRVKIEYGRSMQEWRKHMSQLQSQVATKNAIEQALVSRTQQFEHERNQMTMMISQLQDELNMIRSQQMYGGTSGGTNTLSHDVMMHSGPNPVGSAVSMPPMPFFNGSSAMDAAGTAYMGDPIKPFPSRNTSAVTPTSQFEDLDWTRPALQHSESNPFDVDYDISDF